MKITVLRWSSVAAAAMSAVWIGLLAALVARCKMSGQPFPVLAKFSPFHNHLVLTDRSLTLFPAFALMAAFLLGTAWFLERNFRPLQTPAAASALLLLASPLVILFNPGGYFSWFLS
jgi:hypothetical protein